MEEMFEKDMFRYIELFYNGKRICSTLDYLSPVEYRMRKVNYGVMIALIISNAAGALFGGWALVERYNRL